MKQTIKHLYLPTLIFLALWLETVGVGIGGGGLKVCVCLCVQSVSGGQNFGEIWECEYITVKFPPPLVTIPSCLLYA